MLSDVFPQRFIKTVSLAYSLLAYKKHFTTLVAKQIQKYKLFVCMLLLLYKKGNNHFVYSF